MNLKAVKPYFVFAELLLASIAAGFTIVGCYLIGPWLLAVGIPCTAACLFFAYYISKTPV